MTKYFALAALCLVFLEPRAARAVPPDPVAIQQALDRQTAQMDGSGIVAARIDPSGTHVFVSGVSGNARPLDLHTLFEIGSVTKTFTANVLAQMAMDGEVRLNDPVAKYLPPAVHVPSRNGKQITLLSLATQHSGLPRMPTNWAPKDPDDPYRDYSVADLYAFLNTYRLTRDPGAQFEYSNVGFGLLGDALADRAHSDYAQLIARRAFIPLGMTESRIVLSAADKERFAVGHDADGDVAKPWAFDALSGAGSIRSDLTDMLKYLRCNMGAGPLHRACLYAQQPRSDFAGHAIGLAWWQNLESKFIDHGGDTAGYHALVMMTGDRKTGVVLLSNGPAVADLGAYMIDTRYAVPPQKKTPVLPLDAAALDQYVGTYGVSGNGPALSIRREGTRLLAQLQGQTSARIYPVRADRFEYHVVDASIDFVRQGGAIAGLTLHQNGASTNLYRLGGDGKPAQPGVAFPTPATVTLPPAKLDEYVGRYAFPGGAVLTITRADTTLNAQLTGQGPAPIYPSGTDEFAYRVVAASITFHRDAKGNVASLTLHQGGSDYDSPKLP